MVGTRNIMTTWYPLGRTRMSPDRIITIPELKGRHWELEHSARIVTTNETCGLTGLVDARTAILLSTCAVRMPQL